MNQLSFLDLFYSILSLPDFSEDYFKITFI